MGIDVSCFFMTFAALLTLSVICPSVISNRFSKSLEVLPTLSTIGRDFFLMLMGPYVLLTTEPSRVSSPRSVSGIGWILAVICL